MRKMSRVLNFYQLINAIMDRYADNGRKGPSRFKTSIGTVRVTPVIIKNKWESMYEDFSIIRDRSKREWEILLNVPKYKELLRLRIVKAVITMMVSNELNTTIPENLINGLRNSYFKQSLEKFDAEYLTDTYAEEYLTVFDMVTDAPVKLLYGHFSDEIRRADSAMEDIYSVYNNYYPPITEDIASTSFEKDCIMVLTTLQNVGIHFN